MMEGVSSYSPKVLGRPEKRHFNYYSQLAEKIIHPFLLLFFSLFVRSFVFGSTGFELRALHLLDI
jgi:hypothetical protein